jgi:ribosomal-protein-alanine N-acetyltransferase
MKQDYFIKRKDTEQPFAISKKGMRYHHIGIPTDELKSGEKYLEEFKFFVSGFDTSEYGIELMRFEKDSPVSNIIQKVPHIAFEVDNLDSAIEGKKLIGEISSPSKGVRVAMINENGVPVEFLEFDKKISEDFPELESRRLRFRQILSGDAKELYDIRANNKVMKYMDTEKIQSLSETEKLIESIAETFKIGNGINWGIVEISTNTLIGYFGFWRIEQKHCRGEIGYALHPKYWGKGYMRETFQTMMKFGFKNLKLHSVEANVNPDNLDSIKLLENAGFKKEAYFRENFLFNGEFKDSVIYSLLECDLEDV